jgi:hypothetical protein
LLLEGLRAAVMSPRDGWRRRRAWGFLARAAIAWVAASFISSFTALRECRKTKTGVDGVDVGIRLNEG